MTKFALTPNQSLVEKPPTPKEKKTHISCKGSTLTKVDDDGQYMCDKCLTVGYAVRAL